MAVGLDDLRVSILIHCVDACRSHTGNRACYRLRWKVNRHTVRRK